MAVSLSPFIEWLTARLCADPLIAAHNYAWMDGLVPQDTPFPYVVFSVASSPDGLYSGSFVGHTRPLMQVKAIGLAKHADLVAALWKAADACVERVGQVTISPPAGQTVGMAIRGSHREATFLYPENVEGGGGVTTYVHQGGRYRFMIQEYPQL